MSGNGKSENARESRPALSLHACGPGLTQDGQRPDRGKGRRAGKGKRNREKRTDDDRDRNENTETAPDAPDAMDSRGRGDKEHGCKPGMRGAYPGRNAQKAGSDMMQVHLQLLYITLILYL